MSFLAGLLDWHSGAAPTRQSIAGASCIDQGWAHLKAITETGGSILGTRPLELDGIAAWLFKSQDDVRGAWVQEGLIPLRRAQSHDSVLPTFSTWGFKVIVKLAEVRFLKRAGG